MHIHILAVGKRPRGWVAEAQDDYQARLGHLATVTIDLVSPEDENTLGAEKAVVREQASLLAKLPIDAVIVACDRGGKQLDSPALAERLVGWRDNSQKVCFLIGGSHGLSDELRARADLTIAFGQATWPHELFRVMLLEQLYRGFSILAGAKYHK